MKQPNFFFKKPKIAQNPKKPKNQKREKKTKNNPKRNQEKENMINFFLNKKPKLTRKTKKQK